MKRPTFNPDYGTEPNRDLVRVYGPTYEATYREAFAALPVARNLTEARSVRPEIAHQAALHACGKLHGQPFDPSLTLADLARAYSAIQTVYACGNAKASREYAAHVAAVQS